MATMPCSGSSTSPMPVMMSECSRSATASIASSRRRMRSVRQSLASSTAERIRLPWCLSSLPSKRSNSVNASAVPPAKPARMRSWYRRLTFFAPPLTTTLPRVTWPSPPSATLEPRRTERMVVPWKDSMKEDALSGERKRDFQDYLQRARHTMHWLSPRIRTADHDHDTQPAKIRAHCARHFLGRLAGLIQSLGTPWGLFRHYWVLAKLLLTVFVTIVLLVKMELISYAARLAAETILSRADLRAAGIELAVHAAGGLLLLLVPAALSIYKPWGLTPYGRRKQHEQRALSQQPYLPAQRPFLDSNGGIGVWPLGDSITITLRRAHMYGIIAIILVLHFVILHLTGIGGH